MTELNLPNVLTTTRFLEVMEDIVKENRDIYFVTNDVSNFKFINDFYGIEEGNKVLEEISRFFYTENPHCLAVCRTGSDQFRGVMNRCGRSVEECVQDIVSMNEEFEERLSQRYPDVFIHMYTGVYFLRDGDTEVRKAMDYAHSAKKMIKGKYNIKCQVYTPEDGVQTLNRMETMTMFNDACSTDNLLMFLQPKMSVEQNKVIGAEALVRIKLESGEIVLPGRFVPVLEETGMIGRLDEIMIEKTFKLIRKWMDDGVEVVPISVNVSRQKFSAKDFASFVISLQKKYNVPPKYLEFEVLETTFVDAMDYIVDAINALRDYGFRISVDDFGSGYSSLNQIANIPADVIKIDRVFANTCFTTVKGRTVIKTLIQLLNNINYSVVFEGIETKEQCDMAADFGCDSIQGFFFSRPIPVEEFEKKYIYV
ncbi:MAG TPA: GGDEF domain-containing protein [Eubacterium sp.]|nr:GGDEF domain-containing protein [Eubacterium sp.]